MLDIKGVLLIIILLLFYFINSFVLGIYKLLLNVNAGGLVFCTCLTSFNFLSTQLFKTFISINNIEELTNQTLRRMAGKYHINNYLKFNF